MLTEQQQARKKELTIYLGKFTAFYNDVALGAISSDLLDELNAIHARQAIRRSELEVLRALERVGHIYETRREGKAWWVAEVGPPQDGVQPVYSIYDELDEAKAKAIADELNQGRGMDAWEWDDELREHGDYMQDRLAARRK